jgi:hypothetical protein
MERRDWGNRTIDAETRKGVTRKSKKKVRKKKRRFGTNKP